MGMAWPWNRVGPVFVVPHDRQARVRRGRMGARTRHEW